MALTTAGTGSPRAADLIDSKAYPLIKLATGLEGTATLASATNPIPVTSQVASTASWSYAAATGGIVNSAVAVTIKAAAAAGVRNYLKSLTVGHDLLGAVTELAVRDGAAGTVLWRGKLQTAATEDRGTTFDPPLQGTAATLLEVVTLTAVTGGVFVNATGFTAP